MKNVLRTMTTTAAMTVALGLFGAALAQATDDDGYGDGYQSGAYGRVRSADAGGTIVRADAESVESDKASVNAPLFPGDVLRTDGDQRVEVQLAGGSTVRIDHGGEVVFQSLPNASAKFKDNTVLALNAGVMRVTSRLDDKEDFRIDTRDASIYLLGEGEFRIATDDRGSTRVASLRGVAEVVGNEASVLVRGGMITSVVSGSAPDQPRAYSAMASDGFDRWCASRDDAERVHDRYAAQGDEPRMCRTRCALTTVSCRLKVSSRPTPTTEPSGTRRGSRTIGAPTTTATGRTVPAATSGSRTSHGAGPPITTAIGSGPRAIAGAGSRGPSSPARGSPGRGAR
jgi:hypothetical protein